jgi:uncharacterized cofD-like protein
MTLRALRVLEVEPVAIVGTGDDGGSSGRLREGLGVPPPGDLRMALAALSGDPAGDAERQGLWWRVLQHRFGGTGDVEGHALGNLILVALWEELGDVVSGLDRLARLLDTHGRVLPNSLDPVLVVGDVVDRDGHVTEVRGQARLTVTRGMLSELRLEPPDPRPCPEAIAAIDAANVILLGPGSWFTSVLPHLRIGPLRASLARSSARKVLVLNAGPQVGETEGFTAAEHLRSWSRLVPDVRLDVVLADPQAVEDTVELVAACRQVGAQLHVASVLAGPGVHDPSRLSAALEPLLEVDHHSP